MLLFHPLAVSINFFPPEADFMNAPRNSTIWIWLSATLDHQFNTLSCFKKNPHQSGKFLLLQQTIDLVKDNNAPWEGSENTFLNSCKSDQNCNILCIWRQNNIKKNDRKRACQIPNTKCELPGSEKVLFLFVTVSK